jgi:hypothetical protein
VAGNGDRTGSARSKRPSARARRALGAALVGFALVSLAPRLARADRVDDILYAFTLTLVFGTVDTVFLVHDIAVAAQGDHPSTAFSVVEVVVMAPQAAIFNAASATNMAERHPNTWALYPSLLTSAMLTHGIWSLASTPDKPLPRTRFFGSAAIGINATLSVSAIGALFSDDHIFDRPTGIAVVVLTLPQVVVGSVGLGLYPEDRATWAGYTAWSGVLLAHGVLSIALRGEDRSSSPPLELPPGALRPRILGFGPAPVGGFEGHPPGVGFMLRGSM